MFVIKLMTMLLFARLVSAIFKPKGGEGDLTRVQLASSCVALSLLPLKTLKITRNMASLLCNQLDWVIWDLDGCGLYVSFGYHATARRPRYFSSLGSLNWRERNDPRLPCVLRMLSCGPLSSCWGPSSNTISYASNKGDLNSLWNILLAVNAHKTAKTKLL